MIKWRKILKLLLGTLFMILSCIIYIAVTHLRNQFSFISLSELIFHIKVPLKGANTSILSPIIQDFVLIVPFIFVLGFLPAIKSEDDSNFVIRIGKVSIYIPLNFWERKFTLFTGLLFLFTIIYGSITLKVPTYILNQFDSSTIYEEYYVNPETAKINFPVNKRNLIYIYLESMENTYMSTDIGGGKLINLIPNLTEIQLSNTNFSSSGNINGGIALYNTTWTIAAMVAQSSGIPLSIPINGNMMSEYSIFLPGAYSIGQILENNGYEQVFLIGSDAEFGGRADFMTNHGGYKLLDYNYAVEDEWIPSDYHVWWGYEDKILYENAKRELLRLSGTGIPFNLTMLTVDTHSIGGYVCNQCKYEYSDQYSNVISCADRQIANFIDWVKQQPFYDNTTIVIVGDHNTMDSEYMEDIPNDYQRKVYTAILNSAVDYTINFDRVYSTLDMFPTTLASLGVTIEGNRLGLGTNLYSETKTLVELFGVDELNNQFSKNSNYYNRHIVYR